MVGCAVGSGGLERRMSARVDDGAAVTPAVGEAAMIFWARVNSPEGSAVGETLMKNTIAVGRC